MESCTSRFGEQRSASNRAEIIKHLCALSNSIIARCLNSLHMHVNIHITKSRRSDVSRHTSVQKCLHFIYNIALYHIMTYNNYKTLDGF